MRLGSTHCHRVSADTRKRPGITVWRKYKVSMAHPDRFQISVPIPFMAAASGIRARKIGSDDIFGAMGIRDGQKQGALKTTEPIAETACHGISFHDHGIVTKDGVYGPRP